MALEEKVASKIIGTAAGSKTEKGKPRLSWNDGVTNSLDWRNQLNWKLGFEN